jgi:hypothetical protein
MTYKHRFKIVIVCALVSSLLVLPVSAQDVGAQVESFFADVENVMMAVATSAAVIGFIGLAIMYLGSAIPLIANWKQENPKAANQVVVGLLMLIFVGGGALTAMLSFS